MEMHSNIKGLLWVDFDPKCVKICTFSILHQLVWVLLHMLDNLFLNGTSYNYFSNLKLFSNRGMYLNPEFDLWELWYSVFLLYEDW